MSHHYDRLEHNKAAKSRVRHTGRDDRATTEGVMDPRTRMIVFKLLNRGFLQEINGCLSTGKEANVYHAINGEGQEQAVKIYKTSILHFKDRDKYVSGEHRFKNGYSKNNPRKMVKLWAEKEMRNLNRLHAEGLPVPKPNFLKNNVLVMDFIGKHSWAAPRLKDAGLEGKSMRRCYIAIVKLMHQMLQKCNLVHGDLSEYNILYYKKKPFIIDVSQSVEMDHPGALDFLRTDCLNVNNYFRHNRVNTMTTKQLFDFVMDESITDMDARLAEIQEELLNRGPMTNEEEVDENVFMSSFIPRSLYEVRDAEYEMDVARAGLSNELYFQQLNRLAPVSKREMKKHAVFVEEFEAKVREFTKTYKGRSEGGFDDCVEFDEFEFENLTEEELRAILAGETPEGFNLGYDDDEDYPYDDEYDAEEEEEEEEEEEHIDEEQEVEEPIVDEEEQQPIEDDEQMNEDGEEQIEISADTPVVAQIEESSSEEEEEEEEDIDEEAVAAEEEARKLRMKKKEEAKDPNNRSFNGKKASKADRKAHLKMVKQQRQEKLKTKTPKKIKAQRKKLAKSKKK
eukprot:TRINITY_DN12671_c0_g1_i1.p1 TRINITY_DN12671_c0_g1~~TRINITY_DN12671_c0_g1_i1.p1  ORF type:complete len:566 (-),score=240.17 TRINITY_DN12671_c0_g1_i1:174-1871(-)